MNSSVRAIMLWTLGIVGMGGLLYGLAKLGASPASNTPISITLDATDHVKGSTTAKAVLVEYGDFQCPACAAYEPLVQSVKNTYGDQLAFAFRHYPLPQHKNAMITAQAAVAAGKQEKFWEMHDLLYSKQASWSTSSDIDNVLKGYATDLKLNVETFMNDLKTSDTKNRVQRDITSGSGYNVNGTPSFYLNGQPLTLPITEQELKAKIDAALSA